MAQGNGGSAAAKRLAEEKAMRTSNANRDAKKKQKLNDIGVNSQIRGIGELPYDYKFENRPNTDRVTSNIPSTSSPSSKKALNYGSRVGSFSGVGIQGPAVSRGVATLPLQTQYMNSGEDMRAGVYYNTTRPGKRNRPGRVGGY
jgi:hypothetical protein